MLASNVKGKGKQASKSKYTYIHTCYIPLSSPRVWVLKRRTRKAEEKVGKEFIDVKI